LIPPALPQDPSQWPVIGHSCMQSASEVADPGVRIRDLLADLTFLGPNTAFYPICSPTFVPALQSIAAALTTSSSCLSGPPSAPCTGQVLYSDTTRFDPCPQPSGTACFTIEANPGCFSGYTATLHANGATFTAEQLFLIDCPFE